MAGEGAITNIIRNILTSLGGKELKQYFYGEDA